MNITVECCLALAKIALGSQPGGWSFCAGGSRVQET